ncbi:MAG: NADH-quinone oxidoreductase subunit N, partial [Holosporales bacterium]
EAAIKYFILGALSSALFLYGTSLIYGATGSTDFFSILSALKQSQPHTGLLMTAVGLVLAGLAFKVTLAPFHVWAPDVYEGAPTPVVVLFSAAPKLAVFAALARFLGEAVLPLQPLWSQLLSLFAVASMLVGAFAALNQMNIKRLLAYSTVAHMGYASLALLAPSSESIAQLVIYLVIYGVTVLAAFGCILSLRHHGKSLESLQDYQGLGREHPRIAAGLAVIFFSLAGIPPLAGFFAKLGLFMAAVKAGYGWLVTLAVLTSVVSAGYYLRILRLVYFDVAQEKGLKGLKLDPKMYRETAYVTVIAVGLLVAYALWPNALIERAEAAAATLFVKT